MGILTQCGHGHDKQRKERTVSGKFLLRCLLNPLHSFASP